MTTKPDARKRAHEAIERLAEGEACAEKDEALAAMDAACEEARLASADEDSEWRKSMEAYGFDNVAKVLDRISAERERGRRDITDLLYIVIGQRLSGKRAALMQSIVAETMNLLKEHAQEQPQPAQASEGYPHCNRAKSDHDGRLCAHRDKP